MSKIIDIEKQSKKSQKCYHAKSRNSWNGIIPVTKKSKIKTLYNRHEKINDRTEEL
jgi:hypothetical protein